MQSKEVSFYEWQRRFSSEKKCLNHLLRQRWPNGFVCPRCQFQRGYLIARRRVYECVSCRRQTSVTAGTVFHSTKLPLSKWFWALYWVSTDKGGISALRLQKLVGGELAHRILDAAQAAPQHGGTRPRVPSDERTHRAR